MVDDPKKTELEDEAAEKSGAEAEAKPVAEEKSEAASEKDEHEHASPALAASVPDAGSELLPPKADSKRRRSELGAHEHEHDHAGGDEGDDEDEEPNEELVPLKKRPALLLAQFENTADVLHAAEKVRDAGYTVWDTHSPFPIHGMDRAMGLKDSFLGFLVFIGGAVGITTAVTMIWWMNGVDYPIVVGGKPPFALPSSVPIMFELMVLFSCLTAVFGMFGINKLPRHHHPLFESERFRAASNDKFFISVEAEDPKFDVERTKSFLEQLHPTIVELIEEEIDAETPAEEHH